MSVNSSARSTVEASMEAGATRPAVPMTASCRLNVPDLVVWMKELPVRGCSPFGFEKVAIGKR